MLKHSALTIRRIEQFTNRFQQAIRPERVPLKVDVAGPVDRISYAEAQKLTYRPVRKKIILQPLWATFWFKLQGEVPAAWRNRPVDLLFHGESEGLLWIDGKPAQGLNYEGGPTFEDGGRIDARLPREIVRGGKIALQVEAACNGLGGSQGTNEYAFTGAELALFDQEAWDLFHDLLVPVQYVRALVLENRPGHPWLGHHVPGNLPVWHGYLVEKLNEICNISDPDDRSTWKKIRPLLKEIYSHRNATCAHEMSAIGHSHIDTAWLWPLAETRRKCARSFSTVLSYMRRYPNYKFSCSQAQQYQWMKDEFPTIYAGIKAAVKRGQWIPVGGSWIEPDCNIPSGESLVRQFLHGKRFFRKEFGWDCKEFWNPDVFGYSGALPQIIKQAGMDYFLTQKLAWNQFNKPRHQNFLWQGIDGSRVLTHFPPTETYNALCGQAIVQDLLIHERGVVDHDRTNEGFLLYGYGDGGGGPTTHMLEVLDRVGDLQGFPRTKQRTSLEFFQRLEARLRSAPVVEGELYFELHRGTYTTQAANKRDNRRCEFLLRGVEMLAAVARQTRRQAYPAAELERLWKIVLLNQFHDILPGSSIREVHEESKRDYAEVIARAAILENKAVEALIDRKGGGLSLINTCGWERSGLVELEKTATPGAQKTWKGTFLAPATAPACGAAPLRDAPAVINPASAKKIANAFVLENGNLRAEFSPGGQLIGLTDKRNGREVIDAPHRANQFVLFDDHPTAFDAWDVDIFHLEKREDLPPAERVRILEKGPLRAGLEFKHRFGKSSMTQRIFLSNLEDRIEFECDVDWQHRKQFLKVEFPVAVHAPEAAFEIQFGHVTRPTHFGNSHDMARFEVSAHKWIDLSETGYGASLFTDSKYGYAVHGNVMRISLLRGVESPDPTADLGRHFFRFALFPHAGSLQEAGVVRRASEFNNPWIPVQGGIAEQSWFSVDSPHLIIDTVKKAEDSDALVVRLYECHGARGKARLATSLPVTRARLANLLEESSDPLQMRDDGVLLNFRPFEILTVLLDS
ncbi:MAG: glycoside hydrolase family 38 C-terminal domain-containing protein [Terrimicrobiaceae bacterium]|nr:glycoside hydrolase family 38 C-terminal domain-containing protein [Terrimicrobiaceae bacterium]